MGRGRAAASVGRADGADASWVSSRRSPYFDGDSNKAVSGRVSQPPPPAADELRWRATTKRVGWETWGGSRGSPLTTTWALTSMCS